MAETRPRGEQLRFSSSRTGEHILDDYLEAAEHGGRTIPDMLSDIFSPVDGSFRADLWEFREDPGNPGQLQYRVGDFPDANTGWANINFSDFSELVQQAELAATASQTAQLLSEKWASHPENTVVASGKYSALHHATKAAAAQSVVAASASAAATSATTASTQAANASTSATAASNSATAASGSATTSSTQATNAAASASAAATSATNASNSATAASTSAATATTQASNAATSATAASGSATTATTQASNASTSATNAANSATNAANSATAANASKVAAATSEQNALIYSVNAANSTAYITGYVSIAQGHANDAEAAKIAAAGSATAAASSATAADTSKTAAAGSATAAATSASAADASAQSAAESLTLALAKTPDAIGLRANRSTYDGSPAGFAYLAEDGDGVTAGAVIYYKRTATSGDWSAAIPFGAAPAANPVIRIAISGSGKIILPGTVAGADIRIPFACKVVGIRAYTPTLVDPRISIVLNRIAAANVTSDATGTPLDSGAANIVLNGTTNTHLNAPYGSSGILGAGDILRFSVDTGLITLTSISIEIEVERT